MKDSTDRDLRARFQELRTVDAGVAPVFRELLDRAHRMPAGTSPDENRRLRRFAIPIALAAAIVLAAGVARVARRRASFQIPLSTWTSPTASLLRTPGIGLSVPVGILTSVLDPATSTAALRTGTQR